MRANNKLKKTFYQRLNKTKAFWDIVESDIKFDKYINPDLYREIYQDHKIASSIEFTHGIDLNIAFMTFFPTKEELEQFGKDDSIQSYPYVKVFKHRDAFVEKLFHFISKDKSDVGVLTVNRYGVEDEDIKTSGVFIHSSKIMMNFTPKIYTDDNWVKEWPWSNFGTAFFISLDTKWAVYSTSMDKESLVLFMADDDFRKKFFNYWPEAINFLYKKKNKKLSKKDKKWERHWEKQCQDEEFVRMSRSLFPELYDHLVKLRKKLNLEQL